ncbi:MAG: GtrA family protein [Spongiibacteraceae bacterium]
MTDATTSWIRHFLTAEFLRFLMVGGTAAAIHWFARFFLSIYMPFSFAVALAYFVGIATAFALNRAFVFPLSNKPIAIQVSYFISVNLAFLPIVWAASVILARWALPNLGIHHYEEGIAHGIAIMLPVFGAFLLHKFKTFAD